MKFIEIDIIDMNNDTKGARAVININSVKLMGPTQKGKYFIELGQDTPFYVEKTEYERIKDIFLSIPYLI